MSTINYHKREIVAKIVYYGPGLGGKTTSLEFIHQTAKGVRGDLISLTTDEDRTLYFDYLPVELPKLGGFSVRVQLYTVPGQVYYNATRKLVLDGADGVVFVADSQPARMNANVESLDNLVENLREKHCYLKGFPRSVAPKRHTQDITLDGDPPAEPEEISWVIQYNKRDLPSVTPLEDLEEQINLAGVPTFETVATEGDGILEALQSICMLVLADVRDKGRLREGQSRVEKLPEPPSTSPREKQDSGSMTATSLADITDVVANLSASERAEEGDQDFEEESITRPGPEDRASPTSQKVHNTAELMGIRDSGDTPTSPGVPAVDAEAANPPNKSEAAIALSSLIETPPLRSALRTVEIHLQNQAWQLAVKSAGAAFENLSTELANTMGNGHVTDPATFGALLTAIPAGRLLRFRETQAKLARTSGVNSSDALFAAFFLADFALRADDLARKRGQ